MKPDAKPAPAPAPAIPKQPAPGQAMNTERAFAVVQGLVNERLASLSGSPVTQQAVQGLAQAAPGAIHTALFPPEVERGNGG